MWSPPFSLAGRLALVSGEEGRRGEAQDKRWALQLFSASLQDTLVDADAAIDAMMRQNGGMCGLDHWTFVTHPVDAAMTCDPLGTYVRKWCSELSGLPDELVHQPWKCPASVLRRAGEKPVHFKKKNNQISESQ